MSEHNSNTWEGFVEGNWSKAVDVRDFIQKNYTPYEGDESFLVSEPTDATRQLWTRVMEGIKQENDDACTVDLTTSCWFLP